MSSDRNQITRYATIYKSLVDWDMSSDRNLLTLLVPATQSLVDWDMSSDRNQAVDHHLT